MACLSDAYKLFDEALFESAFHARCIHIETFIRQKGGFVSKTDLTKRFKRRHTAKELYSIVDEMEKLSILESRFVQTGGRKKRIIKLL